VSLRGKLEKGTSEFSLWTSIPLRMFKRSGDQYVHDYARIYGCDGSLRCHASPARAIRERRSRGLAHFLFRLQEVPVTIYATVSGPRFLNVQDCCVHSSCFARTAANCGLGYNIGGANECRITARVVERISRLPASSWNTRRQRAVRRPAALRHDFSKLRSDTGWAPEIDLNGTMESIYQWWKSNRDLLVQPAPRVPVRPLSVLQPEAVRLRNGFEVCAGQSKLDLPALLISDVRNRIFRLSCFLLVTKLSRLARSSSHRRQISNLSVESEASSGTLCSGLPRDSTAPSYLFWRCPSRVASAARVVDGITIR